MAKKRPQSKGGGTKQKKQKKAPTGQRPSLAPRATGVVTTGKAKKQQNQDEPQTLQGFEIAKKMECVVQIRLSAEANNIKWCR